MNRNQGRFSAVPGISMDLPRIVKGVQAWFARIANPARAALCGAAPSGAGDQVDIVCRRRILPREPRVLPIDSRLTVVCEYGTVWITQGGSQDHVLTAGQRLALAPTDTVLITAMSGPAHIHCRAPRDSDAACAKGGAARHARAQAARSLSASAS